MSRCFKQIRTLACLCENWRPHIALRSHLDKKPATGVMFLNFLQSINHHFPINQPQVFHQTWDTGDRSETHLTVLKTHLQRRRVLAVTQAPWCSRPDLVDVLLSKLYRLYIYIYHHIISCYIMLYQYYIILYHVISCYIMLYHIIVYQYVLFYMLYIYIYTCGSRSQMQV